jgi:putative flippase GtrA
MKQLKDYLYKNKKIRYFIVGGVNTFFGYLLGILLYYTLSGNLNLTSILLVVNAISILFSFLMYKNFVFHTKGKWFSELMKCYVVYGVCSIISIIHIIFLVEHHHLEFWIAQAIAVIIVIAYSYFMHNKFTFNLIK